MHNTNCADYYKLFYFFYYRFVKTKLSFEKEQKREKPPNASVHYVWGTRV